MIDCFTGFVYIAVSIIADKGASLPLDLYANPSRTNEEDQIKVIEHPFWDVMYEPNEHLNYYDLNTLHSYSLN